MNAQLKPNLDHRRGYIGGGNIAGILGLSPFKTPLDEFFVITGQARQNEAANEAFFKRRKALEPFAAEVFSHETGREIIARNEHYTDAEHAFIKAEVDFQTDDGWNGETKTVHPLAVRDWGPSGSDEAPLYVIAQAMHGMAVNGAPGAWIHALVGLDDDRIYRIERDEDACQAIRAKAVTFWNEHILPMHAPEPTCVEDILALYPRDSGRVVIADAAAAEDAARLKELKARIKELELEHDEVADRIKLLLRDATTLLGEDGKPLLTWKAQTANRFNQRAFEATHPDLFAAFKQATDMRVLRVK